MFKKRKVQQESNMTYFFGGAAVGMAASFLVKKLLSNVSNGNTQNSEPEVLNRNGNSYSQDDNIHNLQVRKKAYNSCIRSKSASEYKEINKHTEQAMLLHKIDTDSKFDLNNLDINHKRDKHIQKNLYDNNIHTLYNISIEDNASKCSSHSEIYSRPSYEEKKHDHSQLSTCKDSKSIAKHKIALNDTFDLLSIDYCENLIEDVPKRKDSVTDSINILLDNTNSDNEENTN